MVYAGGLIGWVNSEASLQILILAEQSLRLEVTGGSASSTGVGGAGGGTAIGGAGGAGRAGAAGGDAYAGGLVAEVAGERFRAGHMHGECAVNRWNAGNGSAGGTAGASAAATRGTAATGGGEVGWCGSIAYAGGLVAQNNSPGIITGVLNSDYSSGCRHGHWFRGHGGQVGGRWRKWRGRNCGHRWHRWRGRRRRQWRRCICRRSCWTQFRKHHKCGLDDRISSCYRRCRRRRCGRRRWWSKADRPARMDRAEQQEPEDRQTSDIEHTAVGW